MAVTIIPGVQYSGIWTMQQVNAAVAAGTWPRVPGAPIIGTATATGTTTASVTFTAPVDVGNPALTGYKVTSVPGGFTNTGATSPIIVSGLSPSTAYTFVAQATNVIGYGAASAESNSITTLSPAELWSWGYNASGQLGIGNITNYSSPKQIGSLTTWSKVSVGSGSGYGISLNGELWSWGSNNRGALGLGNTTYYSSPKQIGALTNWLSVAGGVYAFAIAVKTDNTIWSWGSNNNGQLGLGNVTNRSSPTQIGGLTNWLSVACGIYFSVATKTDGTIWSWGQNDSGQLGLGNLTYYSSPKQIGALTNWSGISAGAAFVLASKTDGTLWAWGYGGSGQLGLGGSTSRSSPTQIGALTNWSKVGTASEASFAIKTNGTLWSWGSNGNGQLGLGNTTYYSSPKQIGALTTWTSLASGSRKYYIFGAIQQGKLYMWGYGNRGALGLGNTTDYSSPKQVGSLNTWLSLSLGGGSDNTAIATKTV